MIRAEHHANAIRSLHGIFVCLRTLAAEKAPHDLIFKACDIAELLPTLFSRSDDQTEFFRSALEDLARLDERFGLALEQFDGRT